MINHERQSLEQLGEPNPETSVTLAKAGTRDRLLQNGQLLAKRQVLGGQCRMADEQRAEQHEDGLKHAGFPLCTSATGLDATYRLKV